jgi:FtsH-binding integral membrane protein
MGFWEKGYFSSAIIILLTGCAYMAYVWYTSSTGGELAAPDIKPFLIAMLVSIGMGILAFSSISALESRKGESGRGMEGYDERDRLIGLQAKSSASHVMSAGVFASLLAFFIHRDGAIPFYTTFAASLIADLTRCLLQVYYYNRPI